MMRTSENWRDFELLDSGDYMKLERWGQYLISRPEPRALWSKANPQLWKNADATFEGEAWSFKSEPPEIWNISYPLVSSKIVFSLRPTDFKHTGVFPEQAVNWEWLYKIITNSQLDNKPMRILNLFAYTGGTTMACALSGAQVTHVDSSRPAMMWASENAKLSNISKDSIRWIQEDALKFVQREIRRGGKYDAIVMDPPRFGRGNGGEIWKLENDLPKLIHESMKLLTENPVFVLVNAYTADLSNLAIEYILKDGIKNRGGKFESGEIGITESERNRPIPMGIFSRWSI